MTFLAALLLAPVILAPGKGAQTTRDAIRVYAEVSGPATIFAGAGAGAGASERKPCVSGDKRETLAHCSIALEPGDNVVTVTDASGSAEVHVNRYVTTGPQVPGVDTAGFGEGTLHRKDVEARCARCHAMEEAAGKPQEQTLLGTQCVTCHEGLVSRPKQHGPVGQGACLMCHDASSDPQRYAVAWPIQETCFKCHQDIKGAMWKKAYRHGPAAAGRCTTCHDPHGSQNVFWLKKPVWELCTNCHTEKATDRHVVVGFVYSDSHPTRNRPHPRKPGVDFACSSCHNPHAAQARYLWQFDVTVREDLCRTCHAK
ncbi:MAG: cytochrome c3 family protein [Myxococcales bacterium]